MQQTITNNLKYYLQNPEIKEVDYRDLVRELSDSVKELESMVNTSRELSRKFLRFVLKHSGCSQRNIDAQVTSIRDLAQDLICMLNPESINLKYYKVTQTRIEGDVIHVTYERL